ncbi:delphilin isoform X2 [Austrofundulus limnaeus]|nr:PREDICTED: delphilin-like isoform X2 [Austrofundulus limnaeus]
MSTPWQEEDDELKAGVKGLKPKPRFSFNEIRVLLDAVKRNRFILLRKFNQGVSTDTKKQTWAEITNQVNGLGENHREVRQIMKKWTDLKCDGKRRIMASRGPNGVKLRKKILGPVERMVHKILMMSPTGGDGDSDPELSQDEDFPKSFKEAPPYSYLNLNESSPSFQEGYLFDLSPLSSPEKELGDPLHSSSDFDLADDGEQTMDFDEIDDSVFPSLPPSSASLDPPPDNSLLRLKPLHTYSRTHQNSSKPAPGPGPSSSAAPPPPQTPTVTPSSLPPSSSSASVTTNGSAPAASSSSSSGPPDPLPPGCSQRRSQEQVAQLASQSVQQQRASRMLLTSVSRSLETLAQSVQLLVESQQEFVQESLLLQRETVDILRDFSNTTLSMLRDKTNSGPLQTHPPPPPPPPLHHHHPHHPTARF